MDARKVACVAAAAFVGALLIGAATDPANAQPGGGEPVTVTANPDVTTTIVHYGDLALNTADGRHMLLHRVSEAVSKVCPAFAEDRDPDHLGGCKAGAWSSARPQIQQAFDRALSGQSLAMSIEITAAGR